MVIRTAALVAVSTVSYRVHSEQSPWWLATLKIACTEDILGAVPISQSVWLLFIVLSKVAVWESWPPRLPFRTSSMSAVQSVLISAVLGSQPPGLLSRVISMAAFHGSQPAGRCWDYPSQLLLEVVSHQGWCQIVFCSCCLKYSR